MSYQFSKFNCTIVTRVNINTNINNRIFVLPTNFCMQRDSSRVGYVILDYVNGYFRWDLMLFVFVIILS